MKTKLLFLQLIFVVPAIAQQNNYSVIKTVTDTVSGQRTVIKKKCFELKKSKADYEDFVTHIKVFDKTNALLQEAVYMKTKTQFRNHSFRHMIKYFADNHYVVGQQKNGKGIKVTEYLNGKIIKAKKIKASDLYWDDWFEHYSAICAN